MATGIRKGFMFNAPTGMVKYRFVTLDKTTNTVAYATDGTIDGVTIGDEESGVISVQSIKDVRQEFFIEAGGTLTVGMDLIATTDGKAVDGSAAGVVFAKGAGIAGDTVGAYAI